MSEHLPTGFRSDFVQCGEVKLHVVHNGSAFSGSPLEDGRPAILMLHGFPEFWIAWETVMQELGDQFHIVVPDQRGYNKSDAPEGVENYKAKLLVGDMVSLTKQIFGQRNFSVAGHDWGASIAYALAINFPENIDHLFIANGIHPACFQQALIDHPDQAKASSYFHVLRSEGAGKIMAEDGFRRTFSMFEKFSLTPWLTEEMKERYRLAWHSESRLQAMLHWYNSSPIIVPKDDEAIDEAPLYNVSTDKFRIAMPHTLFWGNGDQALLQACHEKLDAFCDDLRKIGYDDADHWILHTHGAEIGKKIKNTLSGNIS